VRRLVSAALVLLVFAGGCASPRDQLTLFAAASLADLAREWQAQCAAQGMDVRVHCGGSLLLVRQIRAGAHADFLLAAGASALELWPEDLSPARVDSAYLANRMVVVTRPGVAPPATLGELTDARFERIVMADFELAPAGHYARAALEQAGVWQALTSHVIKTGDVRMALAAVRTGSADAGFVYTTDLASTPGMTVADFGADDPFEAVHYPLVMLAPETPPKREFWDYLHSESAMALARRHGFGP
jgi:molybdate transport system substrate-binding protein